MKRLTGLFVSFFLRNKAYKRLTRAELKSDVLTNSLNRYFCIGMGDIILAIDIN